jgi:hypothetical protein
MVPNNPPTASGIGGRGRIATAEDIEMMTDFTRNYFAGGTNALATNTHNTNTYNENPDHSTDNRQ